MGAAGVWQTRRTPLQLVVVVVVVLPTASHAVTRASPPRLYGVL